MEAESPAVPPQATILVVDDDDPVRACVSDALAREGYTVVDTADPLEARRIVTSRTVDLLLTDVVMPRMNGIELAERVEVTSSATKVLLM